MAEPGRRKFGEYELLELLGEGGMGQVFRARHEGLDREVAIKFLRMRDDSSTDEGSRKRFERETRIHLELQHPHLVKVFDAGVREGLPFLVMEHMGGGSLAKRVEREGRLSIPEIRRVLEAVSSALAYLHERNMMHRDVKPENVLLDEHGVIKLTDFGLARRREDTMLTGTREFVGTVAYASPEAVTGGSASPASDVYALGMMTYWMITGRLPFDAQSPDEWLHQVVVVQPERPSRSRPDLPPDLEEMVEKMLDKEYERRPLASAIAARAPGIGKEDPPTPVNPKARRGSSRVGPAADVTGTTRQFSRNTAVTFIIACALGFGLFLGMAAGPRTEAPPAIGASPAASPAAREDVELLDHDLVATDRAIHLRGRTRHPVKLRLSLETEGHATRMVDDETATTWHRLDITAPSGRTCRIAVSAQDQGRVIYPEPREIRVPLPEESDRLLDSVSRKLSVAPTPLQMEVLSLDRDDPTILSLEERPHALWLERGQDLLLPILRDQPWSSFAVLSRVVGRASGPTLEPLLDGCLDPRTWSRSSAYIRTRQYDDADRAVTALLERGTASTVKQALDFCRRGKEVWWPELAAADRPLLDGVAYRSLRALVTARSDLARGIVQESSIEDEAHAAYLQALLGVERPAGRGGAVPEGRVQVAAMMGRVDRMARDPAVTFVTEWRPAAAQPPAEWILGGFLLARSGRLAPLIEVGSEVPKGKLPVEERWRVAALLRALGASTAGDLARRIAPWLDHEDEELRGAALEALCRHLSREGLRIPWQPAPGGEKIVERVRRCTVPESTRAVRALVLALLGDETLVPEARGLVGSADPITREGARLALFLALHGEVDPGPDALARLFAPEEDPGRETVNAPAGPRVFLLDPLLPWLDSGIDVRAGDHMRIEFTGVAQGGGASSAPVTDPGRALWVEAIIGDQRVPIIDVEKRLWRPLCRFRAAGSGRLLLRTGIEPFGRAGDSWIRDPLAMISSRAVVLARVERPVVDRSRP